MAIILLLIAAAQEIAQNDPRQTYEFIEKGTLPIEKRTVFGRIVEKREDGYLVEIDAPWESTRRTVTCATPCSAGPRDSRHVRPAGDRAGPNAGIPR